MYFRKNQPQNSKRIVALSYRNLVYTSQYLQTYITKSRMNFDGIIHIRQRNVLAKDGNR